MYRILFCFCLVFVYSTAFSNADPIGRPKLQNSSGIQIYELCSHIQQKYHSTICYEDVGDNCKQELDGVLYDQNSFDFSKMSLSKILNRMTNKMVTCETNDSCLVFHPLDYNPRKSPLSTVMPPFTFSGNLDDLVNFLATNNNNVIFFDVESIADQQLLAHRTITMTFNSRVSLENILLLLAKKYGIAWHVTTYQHAKDGKLEILVLEFLPAT